MQGVGGGKGGRVEGGWSGRGACAAPHTPAYLSFMGKQSVKFRVFGFRHFQGSGSECRSGTIRAYLIRL